VAPVAAWAQTRLRGRDIAGDIAVLRDAYETLHPGLYRYNTPQEMGARFDTLARAWGRDQSLAEAFLSLSRLLATVRCGHTYANFYNQSDAVVSGLFAGRNRLPFHFCWLGEQMVVLRNFSADARFVPGTEILSIDGRSAGRVLRELMAVARADGGNDDKRRSLLEVRGLDGFETFDVFYPLVFEGAQDGFVLRARSPTGPTFHATVAAIDLTERRASMPAGADNNNAPAWTLTFPQDSAALLTMPGWALYNSSWDWRAFLDDAFIQLNERRIARLIVDLRGNEGGLDCGDEVIARLIDAPLTRESYDRRVRYRRVPDRLNQYLDTWDNSFRDWGADATARDDGFFDLVSEGNRPIEPKGPRFAGAVKVLIDAANSSATFQFANIVRANRLVTLIGAPTGGNQRGINGGAFFFLRLPASGLECDLPLIATFPRTPRPDAGIAPDVRIEPSIEDLAAGRDPVLAAALA
jgi:hypothetical protein